ncbi:MAG: class I SAM-dependent methyltransferase [Cyclobacteriaceae bacterium]
MENQNYRDVHAELYDIFYASKDYQSEVFFLEKCIETFLAKRCKRMLELAGGTGNHAVFLANFIEELVVTDNSDAMLTEARGKLIDYSNVSVCKMNMLNFLDFDFKFDVVISLFDSIGYVQTNDNILKVFMNVVNCLSKNGLFIFEFWNAGAFLRHFDPIREKFFNNQKFQIRRISETSIDYVNQLGIVNYKITMENKDNGTIDSFSETQKNRFFLIKEMELLLRTSGLDPVQFYNGYQRDSQIDEDSWHTLCIARKI